MGDFFEKQAAAQHVSHFSDTWCLRFALLQPGCEGSSFPGCWRGSLGSHLHLAPGDCLDPSYFTNGPGTFLWGDSKSVMFYHTGTTALVTAGAPQETHALSQATRLAETRSMYWDAASRPVSHRSAAVLLSSTELRAQMDALSTWSRVFFLAALVLRWEQKREVIPSSPLVLWGYNRHRHLFLTFTASWLSPPHSLTWLLESLSECLSGG